MPAREARRRAELNELMWETFHLCRAWQWLIEEYKSKNFEIYMLIPLIIVLFIEFWPIKSSGSFFTTWNATFLWLYAPFILTFKKS